MRAICDGEGRPLVLLLAEGRMSDHRGAAMMLPALPPARELRAGRGYNSNRFRANLVERGSTPCIPSTRSRKVPLPCDKELYRQRHRIENMSGRFKDWRRIAIRYDGCAPCPLLRHLHRRHRHLLPLIQGPGAVASGAALY